MKKTILLLLTLCMTVFACGYAFASEQPEIFVQLGHSQSINTVAFSSDGRYALAGEGKMIKIWDVITGREIRTLVGHNATIRQVGISPDGKSINSIDGDIGRNTLKIWDINTGKEIETIPLSQPSVVYSLSKDSKYVVTANPVKNDEINLLDAITGNKIKTFQNRERNVTNNITLSRNNRYAASIYENGLVKIWDASSGKLLREIRGAQKIKIQGEEPIDITDDGRFVIFPEYDDNLNRELKLFDYKSGKLIRNIHKYGKNDPAFAMFSPDGRHILWAENNQKVERYVLHLEETTTGRKAWSSEGLTSGVLTANFSPDRKYILAGLWNGGLKLWDISTAKEIRSFSGKAITERAFGYSPVNNLMLSGLNLWDISTGKIVTTIQGVDKSYLLLSPDGKNALAKEHKLLFDIKTGKGDVVFPAEQADLSLSKTIFSPEGRYILSDFEGTLKLWDIFNGNIKMTFRAHANFPGTDVIGFSPDGRYIVSSGRGMGKEEKATLILWDINSGARIWVVTLDNIVAESLNFSLDGKLILLGDSINDSPVLYSAADGRKIKIFEHSNFRDRVSCVAIFSPDGKYILSSDPIRDNVITLWDIATGKEIKLFEGHRGGVNSLAFTLDARHFLSNSYDGTTRLWDISTGKEIVQFISFTDGEWVVITPEGYYNSSANGDKHLNVRIGNNVYGVDQYREKFYRPEVVMAALAGKPITGLALLTSVKPAPSVSIVETPASVSSDEATVKVKVADAGGGIGDVRLYLNGSAVVLDRTRNLAVAEVHGQAQVFSYKVRLVSGKNSIRAIAFNAGNSMQSTDATHEIEASIAAKKPSLHALVIGIQDYENPKLTLKYPVADAQLMAATLRERAAGLFEGVNVVELTTKAQTTKDAITKTLKEMSDKVSPDDLFVFFVASHGTVDDGEYFLISSNVGSVSTAGLKQNALSQDDLKAMIANVPATKKLVIIDTCNAGKLGEAIQVAMLTRGMNEETAIKILSRAVGSTILSASSSVQEALEGYEGHGLFTYVVAEGLKGRADFNKDGSVNTLELATFVDAQVPTLAEQVFKHKQYPMVSPTGQGFPVVMVK